MDAATKVLARDGVDGVSIAKIAAEAGMVPGTIYHHFGTRDALITPRPWLPPVSSAGLLGTGMVADALLGLAASAALNAAAGEISREDPQAVAHLALAMLGLDHDDAETVAADACRIIDGEQSAAFRKVD